MIATLTTLYIAFLALPWPQQPQTPFVPPEWSQWDPSCQWGVLIIFGAVVVAAVLHSGRRNGGGRR